MESSLNRKLNNSGEFYSNTKYYLNGCSFIFSLFHLLAKNGKGPFSFRFKSLLQTVTFRGAKETKLLGCFRSSGQQLQTLCNIRSLFLWEQ